MEKTLPTSKKSSQGFILITAIIVLVVVTVLISIIFSLVLLSLKKADGNSRQISVLDISEAGINYYLWHLSHDSTDYKDGGTTPSTAPYGPYTHNFTDSSGAVLGTYTLYITPPVTGSNRVTVESKGSIVGGNETRTVVAELGIPSFANYSIVANDTVDDLRIGEGTETFGPIHNNGGIHFDGIAHAIVTSAVASYNDPDTGLDEDGVYTTEADPSQVFLASTSFPVPPVDFSSITADFTDLKTKAQASGIYYAASSGSGYHVVVKTNDTFDIYRVTGVGGTCGTQTQPKENITSQVFLSNRAFPANGIVFVEDKLWIDGQINGAQLTFAAAKIGATSSQYKSIIVNNDLTYTNYDGTDKIGLIAQGDVSVGLLSDDDLRIDAALLAQNGRVGRDFYSSSCGAQYIRSTLTLYGSIGTNQRYGFAYTDGSGYQTRNLLYDPYLTLIPPPAFPTTGSYTILSWKEK